MSELEKVENGVVWEVDEEKNVETGEVKVVKKTRKAPAKKSAPKPKAPAKKTETKKDDEVPLCARCGEEPRWLVTNRKTGEQYYYSLGRNCENARQKEKRVKTKARKTPLAEIGLSNSVVAKLESHGLKTVRDVEKLDQPLIDLDGVGPKTVNFLEEFLADNGLEVKKWD